MSAFSSAFFYTFDEKLAAVLNEEQTNYLECLSIPVLKTSKKSVSLKVLSNLMFKKPFSKLYMVKRMKQHKSIQEMKTFVQLVIQMLTLG